PEDLFQGLSRERLSVGDRRRDLLLAESLAPCRRNLAGAARGPRAGGVRDVALRRPVRERALRVTRDEAIGAALLVGQRPQCVLVAVLGRRLHQLDDALLP